MTRAEHLAWAKERALAFLTFRPPDLTSAFASLASDLYKHPETRGHIGIELGVMQLAAGHLSTPQQMKEFIEGFH
jgi:hypothetical protein